MEEKVLIKSERYNVKKIIKVMFIIGMALTLLAIVITMLWFSSIYNSWEWTKCEYGNVFYYTITNYFESWDLILLNLIPVAGLTLIGGLIYLWLRSYELTVTDKRIYGKVAWGRRVDLPVDSVSATATTSVLKGVSVATSSGRISFLVMKNAKEIYEVINNLLLERQNSNKPANATTVIQQNSDEVDKLKKYKDLLDSGVITQEEFDAKKKQLLGL